MNSRPVQGLTVSVEDTNNRVSHGNVGDRSLVGEKKMAKVKKRNSEVVVEKERLLAAEGNKKVKQGGGKKRDGGDGREVVRFGAGNDPSTKKLYRRCKDLLENLMKHKFGWVFNAPVDVKRLKLHDYHKIIKHPMDLGTVKSRLMKHWYKSPKGFAEDVRLTFNNAMTYNEKGQDVHFMADALLKFFEEEWAAVRKEFNLNGPTVDKDARRPKPTSKKAPVAKAPGATHTTNRVPSPKPSPLERRNLERSEPTTVPMESNSKAPKVSNQDKTQVLKKNKEREPEQREMTYEEKQRLSADLQNLPSEELDGIVQIIRKRKPGLFQQEDEIEVDIESFDSETLWELHGFVANYKRSLSGNNANAELDHQEMEVAEHDVQEHNMTSSTTGPLREFGHVEKIGTPVRGEKHGDNVSQSSSSSSDSGSSSSDSDSNSSSDSGQ